jgi:putative membrane protein
MRRTRLANERTYLAWWRTGLASFAVSVGTGKLVPELSHGATWPFTVLGAIFALLGSICIAYAFWRHREVEQAIVHGGYAPPHERAVAALTIIGALLGFALVAVLLAEA